MGRVLLLVLPLLALGCSSAAPAAPPRPLVLAILPTPALQALSEDEDSEDEPILSGGDFLLEVATQLSAEPRLDLCFVPGPVVGSAVSEEDLGEVLLAVADGFGQIAAPVYLGLSKEDAARPRLLEALKESVRDHPGQPSVWGKSVLGWRPLALSAGADLEATEAAARAEANRAQPQEVEDDAEDEARALEIATPLLVVLGDPRAPSEDSRVRLRIVSGALPEVVPFAQGLELRVPPRSSGLYALATLHPDRIELEWRSVDPERVKPPAPVSLAWPGQTQKSGR
tara:strand:+ start:507 stop:1358 length:852 start_codon:yes stop_codon:yes gene_type:complete